MLCSLQHTSFPDPISEDAPSQTFVKGEGRVGGGRGGRRRRGGKVGREGGGEGKEGRGGGEGREGGGR